MPRRTGGAAEAPARHATLSPNGTRVVFTFVQGRFGVDDRAEGAVVDLETDEVSMLGLPDATHVRFGPS